MLNELHSNCRASFYPLDKAVFNHRLTVAEQLIIHFDVVGVVGYKKVGYYTKRPINWLVYGDILYIMRV